MLYARTLLPVLLVAAIVLLAACGGDSEPSPPTLEPRSFVRSVDDCDPGTEGCAWVRLDWLEARGGAEPAARGISAWIDARVYEPLGDHWTVESAEDLARAMFADRAEFLNEFPDASATGWYLERTVRVLASPDDVISLEFRERRFTGGAHGMESVRLVSFDPRTGDVLGLERLVDADRRNAFFEGLDRGFRAARGLGPDDSLPDAGFWLEDGSLPPTDNLARVSEGIRVHYDAYEIAPYAAGPTDLVVPWPPP